MVGEKRVMRGGSEKNKNPSTSNLLDINIPKRIDLRNTPYSLFVIIPQANPSSQMSGGGTSQFRQFLTTSMQCHVYLGVGMILLTRPRPDYNSAPYSPQIV